MKLRYLVASKKLKYLEACYKIEVFSDVQQNWGIYCRPIKLKYLEACYKIEVFSDVQ